MQDVVVMVFGDIYRVLRTVVPILVPTIIVPGSIAFAIAPEPVPLLVIILTTIAGGYICTLLSGRYARAGKREAWSRIFEHGDSDGTVRRALASLGIELVPAKPVN